MIKTGNFPNFNFVLFSNELLNGNGVFLESELPGAVITFRMIIRGKTDYSCSDPIIDPISNIRIFCDAHWFAGKIIHPFPFASRLNPAVIHFKP
jgi:hypothetical protein